MSGARILVAASLLTVAVACTDSAPDTGPPTSGDGGPSFKADINQSRPQEGTRQINAHLTNITDHEVTVVGIALDVSQIAPLPSTPKESTFAPGQEIDVVTEYGEPRCEDAETEGASFVVTLADGSSETVPVDPHGVAWLNRLYADECGVKAIHAVASVEYGSRFERAVVDGEPVLAGTLLLRRTAGSGDATLTVRSLSGSVLIRFEPLSSDGLPATLAAADDELSIPVLFAAFRCDPHALAGSTQTFLLSAYAVTAGVPQQRLILVPDKKLQRQILALIHDTC